VGVRLLIAVALLGCAPVPGSKRPGDTASAIGAEPSPRVAVRIVPESPVGGEILHAEISLTASDGPPVTLSTRWTVDGRDGGVALTAGPGARDERWRVTVTASAPDGDVMANDEVVVANAGPILSRARIVPDAPTSADVLTAEVDAADPDGDLVELEVSWWADGVLLHVGPELTDLRQGMGVEAHLVATDGLQTSEPVVTAEVSVGNGPPSITSIAVAPDPPTVVSGAGCAITVDDPDADPTTVAVTWTVDGLPAGVGVRLDPVRVVPDAVLACTGVPSDPFTSGAPATSGDAVVLSTPPEAPWLRVHPVSPWVGEPLWCWLDDPAWDPDGDALTAAVTWFVDDVTWDGPTTTRVLPGDGIPPKTVAFGERWRCEVTVTDGGSDVSATASAQVGEPPGGNVLILLADDMGVDKVGVYGEHPEPPPTPVIDALAAGGVLFRNAYASPSCSPTRASLLTGRYPRRSGLGEVVQVRFSDYQLRLDEVLLPEVLGHSSFDYTSVALGKWHLAGFGSESGMRHPLDQGFSHHAGSFGNPGSASQLPEEELGYEYWEKVVDGEAAFTRVYMTTDTVDDAIAQVAALPEPWFLYVALNAPHDPFHLPPEHLHGFDLDESSPPPLRYAAMVEAMDTELGRLLDSIDPAVFERTTVVFAGDNGTHEQAIRPPWDAVRSKTTLFEGGVNVPLVVSGPLVSAPGSECGALVHVADLFATVAEIGGVRVQPPGLVEPVRDVDALDTDGLSLLPFLADPGHPSLRRYAWTEKFADNGFGPYRVDGRTVQDAEYKLVTYQGGDSELYAVGGGTWDEGEPLDPLRPADAAALRRLERVMNDHLERLAPVR
jgi:arylsulfatase B